MSACWVVDAFSFLIIPMLIAEPSLMYPWASHRTMVLLPDKVPLPSLLVDLKQLTTNSNTHRTGSTYTADAMQPKAPLTDAEFLQRLVDDKLPGWGHEVKLRVIYLLLCRYAVILLQLCPASATSDTCLSAMIVILAVCLCS